MRSHLATFTVLGLDASTADALRRTATVHRTADESPGYPCRQCLRDAEVGDALVLVSHDPFDGASPYRSASPIFLHRDSCSDRVDTDLVPEQLRRRLVSVRRFDADEMMLDGRVLPGEQLDVALAEAFADEAVALVHVHNAGPGCFAARVERA